MTKITLVKCDITTLDVEAIVCETGSPALSPGCQMKARHVIHAVGPRYFVNPEQSPTLLENAYRACLKEAARLEAKSVALPSISTGICGYPVFPAAKIAVRTVKAEAPLYDFHSIVFCCPEEETFQIYKRLLNWEEA